MSGACLARHCLPLLLALLPLLAMGAETRATARAADGMQHLRIALQWRPQSQFAGYYLARDKGIYRASGLDVRLIHADTERASLAMLAEGSVELATAFLADGIIAALTTPTGEMASGSDVPPAPALVQIAQFMQVSNLLLIAWKDMGVEQAADLDGLRISHWRGSFSIAFDALFKTNGITPIRVPQYDSIHLFLKRGVAACAAMRYNEDHRIWQAGVENDRLTRFVMRDHGYDFPEDGLYVRADWLREHRETARAVREATLAGWAYAREHPEEALDLVLAEAAAAGVPANRPHERWMLDHILAGIFLPGEPTARAGTLDPAAFERTASALVAAGFLSRAPAFDAFAPLDARAN